MPDELPEVIDIGEVRLKPGIPFYYAAWGIRYRFNGGDWRVTSMAFNKKVDANDWMERNYLKVKGLEAELIQVKRTVLLDEAGNIKTEIEELTE